MADKQEGFTEAETKAMDGGWVPSEEWKGDPDLWVSAPKFNQIGQMMDRISSTTRQVQAQDKKMGELMKTMSLLGKHNQQLAAAKAKENIAALKVEKVQALEDNNNAAVVEIDEELAAARALEAEMEAAPEVDEPVVEPANSISAEMQAAYMDWTRRTPWYGRDEAMRLYADHIGNTTLDADPGMDPADVIQAVEAAVKKRFAPKAPAGAVDDSGRQTPNTNQKTKFNRSQLNEEQKQVFDWLHEAEGMTIDEYVAQLDEVGGREDN